ncbi:hypothetical protein Bca101_092028 [Brassica carinata]
MFSINPTTPNLNSWPSYRSNTCSLSSSSNRVPLLPCINTSHHSLKLNLVEVDLLDSRFS